MVKSKYSYCHFHEPTLGYRLDWYDWPIKFISILKLRVVCKIDTCIIIRDIDTYELVVRFAS